MDKSLLMKGNEALAEGAVMAGCRYYFGYPITPQNEVPAYMSWRLPEMGGVFVQAESEVASINMVLGAAAAGARTMTTTSSPGFSLMQEGVSYLCGTNLPCVIANVQRGGPGLGNILPSQADYFQATKGGGHGDYNIPVLAPSSAQEMFDLAFLAFDIADKYRTPVLILTDGVIGQMMETVHIKDKYEIKKYDKSWALTGAAGREKNVIKSLWLDDFGLENNNIALQAKYKQISETEVRFDSFETEDAEVVIVAYGLPARIAKSAVNRARKDGYKAGILRPITLFPFPYKEIERLTHLKTKTLLTVEMSAGQLVEDVRLGANGKVPVELYGTMGGRIPEEETIYQKIVSLSKKK